MGNYLNAFCGGSLSHEELKRGAQASNDMYPSSLGERTKIHSKGWVYIQDLSESKDVKDIIQDAMNNRFYAVLSDDNLKLFTDEETAELHFQQYEDSWEYKP